MDTRNSPPDYCYETSYFKQFPDYAEGNSADTAVYFGNKHTLKPYYDDINRYGTNSSYLGRVFYPERPGRREKWSYEKNMAFWAGIIDRNRPLVLVTDIKYYPKNNDEKTGTLPEIFWLLDNGYRMSVNTIDPTHTQTAFVPPERPKEKKILIDYDFYSSEEDVLTRARKIRDDFIKKREQQYGRLFAKTSPVSQSEIHQPMPGVGGKQPRTFYNKNTNNQPRLILKINFPPKIETDQPIPGIGCKQPRGFAGVGGKQPRTFNWAALEPSNLPMEPGDSSEEREYGELDMPDVRKRVR